MHERERHKLILNAVQERPVATLGFLVNLTGTSEATIRRYVELVGVPGRRTRQLLSKSQPDWANAVEEVQKKYEFDEPDANVFMSVLYALMNWVSRRLDA